MTKTQHELDADVGRMLRELTEKTKDGTLRWNNWLATNSKIRIYAYVTVGGEPNISEGPILRKALEQALA